MQSKNSRREITVTALPSNSPLKMESSIMCLSFMRQHIPIRRAVF